MMQLRKIVKMLLCLGVSGSLCHASDETGWVLPDGKALKLEVETVQTLTDGYFAFYPERSNNPAKALFKNRYISDGPRFRLELERFNGGTSSPEFRQTIAYDGKTLYSLRDPEGALTVTQKPLNLVSPGTGEPIMSPFNFFYDRNPLFAIFQWSIPDPKNEAKFFQLNHFNPSTALGLLDTALKSEPDRITKQLAANINGIDPKKPKIPGGYRVYFDPRSKRLAGWRMEAQNKSFLRTLSISEWKEFNVSEGQKILLPTKAQLNYSYARKDGKGYALWIVWDMEIKEISVIDPNQTQCFTINPELANSIYDENLGRDVPIWKTHKKSASLIEQK